MSANGFGPLAPSLDERSLQLHEDIEAIMSPTHDHGGDSSAVAEQISSGVNSITETDHGNSSWIARPSGWHADSVATARKAFAAVKEDGAV